jgi:cyclic-di-GMP-binding protein
MAKNASFDISTGVDLQEVDNAVNTATREVATRYDFKGTSCTLEFDREAGAVKIDADDEYRLQAVMGVLREKLTRRGVPVKNLDEGKVELGSLGRARQSVALKQGIDQETAKRMSKDIRDGGFKKVQVSIQGEELRVTAASRDTLQDIIAFVKGRDYGVELQFGNYR